MSKKIRRIIKCACVEADNRIYLTGTSAHLYGIVVWQRSSTIWDIYQASYLNFRCFCVFELAASAPLGIGVLSAFYFQHIGQIQLRGQNISKWSEYTEQYSTESRVGIAFVSAIRPLRLISCNAVKIIRTCSLLYLTSPPLV